MPSKDFNGKIKVASRIIDYLSSGLYHSPAACLKELINNSYDADAKKVLMFVKPDANRIIIEDDGVGISREDFVSHFERISESHKRDDGDRTASGRQKVGKIGIGFIAANEICDRMEIFSTKAGSKELMHVIINFAEMRRPIEERRVGDNEFIKGDYEGEVLEASIEDHYTQIFLEDIRGEARNILTNANSKAKGKTLTLYGLDTDSAFDLLDSGKIKSWEEFDFYSHTMLSIALNIPVPYYDYWIDPDISTKNMKLMEEQAKNLNFSVIYDGSELRKPTVIPLDEDCIAQDFNFSGDNVSAKGYFYAKHGTINPQELHGVLLRVRNAAIGEYDSTFLGFPRNEFQIIQQWVTCEIWADDRLEAAMNIDRRTLREVHPAYVELRNAFHDALKKFLARARKELYEKPSVDRKIEKATEARERVIAAAERAGMSDSIAITEVTSALNIKNSSITVKQSIPNLKKLEVYEIYDLILTASDGIIDKASTEKIIERITKLLEERKR